MEGLILKLKLHYFGHLMQRADSLEKTPMLGKIEGRRKKGRQKMRWFDGITNSLNMSLSKEGQGSLECCSPWGRKESDTTERQNSGNMVALAVVVSGCCPRIANCILFLDSCSHRTIGSFNLQNRA